MVDAPDPTPADELETLAAQVRRLRPDWRDAEGFYELRSEIAGSLMRLSRRLGHRLPSPATRPAPLRIARPIGPGRAVGPVSTPIAVIARPEPQRPVRASVAGSRRHRYPRPPALPPTVQPQLL